MLDTDRRELHRDDKLVSLEPKVFDLLVYLISRRDSVVSKDDLLASVWEGRIVSESALATRINAARSAIGDTGEEQRLIKTLPRKGVRFVGQVHEQTREQSAVSRDKAYRPSWAPRDRIPIAVLPFINLSGDPNQEYFADGMVEDITIALGRLSQLFVIGSTSAFVYKNRAVDVRQIGGELGVRYVLRGSVRKEDNRFRVTTEVTETANGGHIWADRFEGELDSVFTMQDRVAAHVSTAVSPALQAYEIKRAVTQPTRNMTAYDLFLRALPVHHKTHAQSKEALKFLTRAIELDPSYGTAYGFAAWCYQQQKQFGWLAPTDPRLKHGVDLANAAAIYGADDSEALWMAGYTLTLMAGEFERSLRLTERSIALNPSSANALWASATARVYLGDLDSALVDLEHARRLEPLNPLAEAHWMSVAVAHFFAGRYEEAYDAASKSLEALTNFPPALRLKVVICGLLGRIDEGRACLHRLLAVNPETTVAGLKAYYDPVLRDNQNALDNYLRGLRLSGVPES